MLKGKLAIKILLGFLLAPLAIFVVGAVLVVSGGVLNSVFKTSPKVSLSEPKATASVKPGASQSEQASRPIQVTKPSVTYATAYYNVSGLTVEDIRASKSSARQGTFFEGHDAATTAKLDINFKRRQTAGGCEAVMDRFNLGLTYTYPRLTTLAQVAPDVAVQWNQFIAALKVHEEGHAKIEVARAGQILVELQQSPTSSTCEAFDQVWQAKTNSFDAESKKIEAAYDRDTKSGQTQGVRF